MIYFANPKSEYIFLKKKINKKINDVLNSNSYILGNEVRRFENRFSMLYGASTFYLLLKVYQCNFVFMLTLRGF